MKLMTMIQSGFQRLKKKIAESRRQRRLKIFCSDLHYTGYTCLPCGTLIWDGIGAVDELKQRYGEEELRRLCMDAVFHSNGDTGESTPGKGVDLAYRLLSRVGSRELVDELVELREEWEKSGTGKPGAALGDLRRLEVLTAVICKEIGILPPVDSYEPTFQEEMDAFADYSYG